MERTGARPRPERRGAYADEVLDAVQAIPPGRVLTYGDVAELLGWGAARSVGAVLSRHGGAVAWWRVVRADGTLPPGLSARAGERWAQESTPRRGEGVDLGAARWDGGGWDGGG